MNALMSVAVIGAMTINEWSEAAMVIFLFSVAQLLEHRSMERARRSVNMLIDQSPKKATIKSDGKQISIQVNQVKTGQIVYVKPGEKCPVDGTVIKGISYFDESTITGESKLIRKNKGDFVFAGSINQNGTLEIQSEKEYNDSTLSRIIHLVSEAQAQKANHQTFIEKFSHYYTPVVFIIALLVMTIPTFVFSQSFTVWFYRSLVLLVIACPCALVISTPITIVSGLTNAMNNGILIKGGIFLENFYKTKTVALDKTGTITEGRPIVNEIIPLNNKNAEQVISIAASIESMSEHHLAKAVMDYAEKEKIDYKLAENFQAISGRGAKAEINNKIYWTGNHSFCEDLKLCNTGIEKDLERIESDSQTAILVGDDKEVIGIIGIGDKIRKNVPEIMAQIKSSGVSQLIMLTGDNRNTAQSVSVKTGIDTYYYELLPDEKVDIIKKKSNENSPVVMIGDGINDAPSIAAASIGVAMGKKGSDITLETADITLMKDDLSTIPYLLKLSKKTVKLIKQNIFIALLLKFIFLALAIPGFATLWMAVFADMGGSLIVIFNGMRALKKI